MTPTEDHRQTAADLMVEVELKIAVEAARVIDAAREMLAQLAAGRDPISAYHEAERQVGARYGGDWKAKHLDARAIIRQAWERWDATRRPPTKNPYAPTAASWPIAELMLDAVGTLIPYAEVRKINVRYGSPSAASVASVTVDVANANFGRIVPMRGKVKSRAAYGLRESNEQPPRGDRWYEPVVQA